MAIIENLLGAYFHAFEISVLIFPLPYSGTFPLSSSVVVHLCIALFLVGSSRHHSDDLLFRNQIHIYHSNSNQYIIRILDHLIEVTVPSSNHLADHIENDLVVSPMNVICEGQLYNFITSNAKNPWISRIILASMTYNSDKKYSELLE